MAFWAAEYINGKMVVEIGEGDFDSVHVYAMPADIDEGAGYVGAFEKAEITSKDGHGTYYAPSDWIIFLHYTNKQTDEKHLMIKVKTWVEPFLKSDISLMSSTWNPTSTFYMTAEQLEASLAARNK